MTALAGLPPREHGEHDQQTEAISFYLHRSVTCRNLRNGIIDSESRSLIPQDPLVQVDHLLGRDRPSVGPFDQPPAAIAH